MFCFAALDNAPTYDPFSLRFSYSVCIAHEAAGSWRMRRSVVNIGTDTGGITVEESASEGRFPGER